MPFEALSDAIFDGDAEKVRALLAADSNLLNEADFAGLTALHIAARRDLVEIVRELLSRGASCDRKSKYGVSAFGEAARQGNVEVMAAMIDHGSVDIHTQDMDKNTPLHVCCYQDDLESVEFLLAKGADLSKKNGDSNTPCDLVDPGSDVEAFLKERDLFKQTNAPSEEYLKSKHEAQTFVVDSHDFDDLDAPLKDSEDDDVPEAGASASSAESPK